MKYEGQPREEDIRNIGSPAEAALMGRDRSFPLPANWNDIKYGIMRDAVSAKFSQHADLKQQLLETGNRSIVEHTANDSLWGDGGDGSGQNW
eukprot:CAMPEP_0204900632 /NCGR_PEP_ID=MMETSP1397-20131031/2589_1 /ASSEMBLY_ACC=CAM_ASM_000891 /TAXON_ID=49980 /ORGANISM="Climacostomum Climacostomum virens, Strain Stock W-24" /LENGTH=91 /DNA_ID=CAMNT_0052068815 /DNA_START=171 /DNA_END=443 /DNA_ORIENTATION=-